MIYASVESALSLTAQLEPRHDSGALDIKDRLLDAVLTSGHVREAHLFSDTPTEPVRTLPLQRHVDEKRLLWKHLALLPQLVEQHQYVAVCTDASAAAIAGARAALGHLAFPICSHVHSLIGCDVLGQLALSLLRAEPCDCFVVSSHAVRRAFLEAAEESSAWIARRTSTRTIAVPSVEHLPAPIDTMTFRPRDAQYCRQALGLPPDALIILSPRRTLRRRKEDPEPLLITLKDIANTHSDAFLVVAGADTDVVSAADIERQATQLECNGRLRIISGISAHLKPLFYGAADIFLSPEDSIQSQTELSWLEAMSCGVPVIVTDWMDSGKVIKDGVNGITVPTCWNPVAAAMMSWLAIGAWPEYFLGDRTIVDWQSIRDGLLKLLPDQDRRRSLGHEARRTIEATHSAGVVARAAMDIWARQLSTLEQLNRETDDGVVDYSRLFKHYATSELDMRTPVRISRYGRSLGGDGLSSPDIRHVPATLRQDVSQLLDMCRNAATTVGDGIAGGTELSFEALVWMLKSGYLELEPAPIANAREMLAGNTFAALHAVES